MAYRNWRVGLLAVIAGTALAGCLPELGEVTTRAPAEVPSNTPPVIGGTPISAATAGVTWQFLPSASDADGDELTFNATGLPGWASINPQSGLLSGTPAQTDVGTSPAIVITVSDGEAGASLPAFSIVIASAALPPAPPPPEPPVNTRPAISGSPALTVQATSAYAFTPAATDAETPQALTFAIVNKPVWASFSTTTGALAGTPAVNQTGTYANILISVSDGSLSAALPAFTISVTAPPNQPPVIAGTPPSSIAVGSAYSFRPTASDPDGQTLTYSISNKPAWASFSDTTGRLSGTPTDAHVGTTSNIVISVTDTANASAALPAFSLTVTAPPPTGSAALSWAPPTQFTDGSSLPLSELDAFRIYYGTSAAALDRLAEVDNAATTFSVANLQPGTHYFAVTAVSITGAESAFSPVRSKTIP